MTKHNHNYSVFATDEQFKKLKSMIGKEADVPLSSTGRAVLISVVRDYATWVTMKDGKPINKSFTLRTDFSWNVFFMVWMKGIDKNYKPILKTSE